MIASHLTYVTSNIRVLKELEDEIADQLSDHS